MIEILAYWIIVYFLLVNIIYIVLAISASREIKKKKEETSFSKIEMLLQADFLPTLSIVVPAYNESDNIIFCLETLLNLSYRFKELVVVNDGSTDDTLKVLKHHFKLNQVHIPFSAVIPTKRILGCYQSMERPELIVINKENGKKADAINAGINASQGDYILVIDADTLIDSNEMNQMIRYLLINPFIKAAGATVRVGNSCSVQLQGINKVRFPKSWIAGMQAVEYLRAFLIGRAGWVLFNGSLIISGAYTLFNTETLKNLKGFDPDMLGEDMELVVRFKREQIENKKSPETHFIPDPVAWTEVPENLRTLGKQRTRWHLGLLQVLWKHRKIFFNPFYGRMGLFVFPFFVFAEALAPVIELAGYFFIFLSKDFFLLLVFLCITWGLTTLMNIHAVLLEQLAFQKYQSWRDFGKMLACCFFENVGYRQCTLWWRLKAFWRILFQQKQWDIVIKGGFGKADISK
jgi:cellulose synthase/poly-beta-1,6-N-acetylglucosamine synthase-like glycosyltransferase